MAVSISYDTRDHVYHALSRNQPQKDQVPKLPDSKLWPILWETIKAIAVFGLSFY